ncbi:MAG: hypothetical protein M2R45_03071 [Verrucomicrobia subdivision 3 bacterium]|nr:hypothetical protein [Limisphaerales bacterium]MCS1416557.1 hypothetical protein [Limisphaerales bacterium]
MAEVKNKWEKITRKTITDHEKPLVSLSKVNFRYNAGAVRLLQLSDSLRVIYYVNEYTREIRFEFIPAKDADDIESFKIQWRRGGKDVSSDIATVRNKPWIKSVALLPNAYDRRFPLHLEGKYWVAQLCPAFEIKISRSDVSSIPADATGIYRYLNSKTIVYIGKGNIRPRLRELGRDEWQFDTIEYSVVPNDKQALKWESYWIDRFRESNDGKRPVYNLIDGHSGNNTMHHTDIALRPRFAQSSNLAA